jgi:hypothetical protein
MQELSADNAPAFTAEDALVLTRVCLGAITGPDGATSEQHNILSAIARHMWQLPDLNLSTLTPLTPAEAGAAITIDRRRRRARELLVLLELCRHPLEPQHTKRIEEYCEALSGGDGAGIALARNFVSGGVDAALADWFRRFDQKSSEMMEPAMVKLMEVETEEAAARLEEISKSLQSAAPGTLGAEFRAFYERNGFTLSTESMILFGHDMAHVIGGYDATSIGEICIGAMKLMITDSEIHWLEFLGNVMIHETGILPEGYQAHEPPLQHPGNVDKFAHALQRGRDTAKDFSVGDHLSMIDWRYEDVLQHYGVAPH